MINANESDVNGEPMWKLYITLIVIYHVSSCEGKKKCENYSSQTILNQVC